MATESAAPDDPAAPLACVKAVRRRLAREGPPRTRDAERDFERISVPDQDCDALRDLLIQERAGTVVEIGLAYGSSALAIGEALISVGSTRPHHLAIDPMQETVWDNVGWETICAAGLGEVSELITEPSQTALPRLLIDGFTADAAFVDGSHRFHEVFVDLYFLRKIVQPGGLIVLDDYWWPSVHIAARYYETNLGWTPIAGSFASRSPDPGGPEGPADEERKRRGSIPGTVRVQAFRLPHRPFEPSFDKFRPF